MKKNNIFRLLFVISLLVNKILYGQKLSHSNYVVITYVEEFSKSFEGVKKSYWIAPIDSISKSGIRLYPLLFSGYLKSDIKNCCSGIAFDPYYSQHNKSNQIDSSHLQLLDSIKLIISKGRRKLQIIKKKWDVGVWSRTTVYASPISGIFCSSKFDFTGQIRTDYLKELFISYSTMSSFNEFWESEKKKYLIHIDFSKLNLSQNIEFNQF